MKNSNNGFIEYEEKNNSMFTKNNIDVELLPRDKWVEKVDVLEVEKDFNNLRRELERQQGSKDVAHLNKIILWSQILNVLGLGFMILSPSYIFPSLLLSTAIFIRWGCIAHHVCHGGYNNVVLKDSRFNRFKFAIGSVFRRLRDWPDWILPEAWNHEHNHLHHYYLNEDTDPDLVEQNLETLRDLNIPLIMKYLFVIFNAMTWKWFYYSSNTYANLIAYEKTGKHAPTTTILNLYFSRKLLNCINKIDFTFRVLLPYVFYRFILIPLPIYLMASLASMFNQSNYADWLLNAYQNAILNMFVSDIITNIHSYIVIVPNHAGNDMYRWKTHATPLSGAFYIRAIVSSANYSAGNDYIDVIYGWLNYQIEHHCFPKLSMLSYQKAMPQVKALAKKHGIPYTQENVFLRFKKMIDISIGVSSMRTIPLVYENKLNIILKNKK